MQELENWKTKFDVAKGALEGYFSKRWVAENLLGLSEDEFIRMQREMFHDRKFTTALEAAGSDDAAKDAGGGLGDLGGGDTGGGLDLGDLGGGDTPDTPAADTGAGTDTAGAGGDTGGAGGDTGGGDDTLLAAPPAKRDDEPKKRGPYKRHKTTYRKGGLSKQMKSQATGEVGTSRKTFPGKVGFGGLDSLGRGVVQESVDVLEETKLFNTSVELQNLIESLTKGNQDETQ